MPVPEVKVQLQPGNEVKYVKSEAREEMSNLEKKTLVVEYSRSFPGNAASRAHGMERSAFASILETCLGAATRKLVEDYRRKRYS
jgi:hypothetical protein